MKKSILSNSAIDPRRANPVAARSDRTSTSKNSCTVKSLEARDVVQKEKNTAIKRHNGENSKKVLPRFAAVGAALCAACLALILLGGVVEQRVQAAVFTGPSTAVETPIPWVPPTEQQRLEEARLELVRAPEAGRGSLVDLYGQVQDPVVLRKVVALLVRSDAPDWPQGVQGQFLRSLTPSVLVAARGSSVPPSVTLAQAILESGWGRSSLAREANNLFGVKASPDAPAYRTSGGSRYRVYEDWESSLAHHNALLSSSPRYAATRDCTDDWQRYLKAMAPVYATSRTYVHQVSDLVERYGLQRWDDMVFEHSQRLASASAREDDADQALAAVSRTVTR